MILVSFGLGKRRASVQPSAGCAETTATATSSRTAAAGTVSPVRILMLCPGPRVPFSGNCRRAVRPSVCRTRASATMPAAAICVRLRRSRISPPLLSMRHVAAMSAPGRSSKSRRTSDRRAALPALELLAAAAAKKRRASSRRCSERAMRPSAFEPSAVGRSLLARAKSCSASRSRSRLRSANPRAW